MKRLIPFLVLNIIVSAITTLLVLRWWDQNHREKVPTASGSSISAPTQAVLQPVVSQGTLPPLESEWIRIDTVIGAGDLNNEVVVLTRSGEEELSLTGWQVMDEDGNRYTFPELVLNKNGSVRLYTRSGQSTVIELFWGLEEAVWKSGELVTVQDPQGNNRAAFRIP